LKTPVYFYLLFCASFLAAKLFMCLKWLIISLWFCAPSWQWMLLFRAMHWWIAVPDVLLARCKWCSFGEDFKHSCWYDLPSSAGNNHQRYAINFVFLSWRIFAHVPLSCIEQIFLIIMFRSLELLLLLSFYGSLFCIKILRCLVHFFFGLTKSTRYNVQKGSKRTCCNSINACGS